MSEDAHSGTGMQDEGEDEFVDEAVPPDPVYWQLVCLNGSVYERGKEFPVDPAMGPEYTRTEGLVDYIQRVSYDGKPDEYHVYGNKRAGGTFARQVAQGKKQPGSVVPSHFVTVANFIEDEEVVHAIVSEAKADRKEDQSEYLAAVKARQQEAAQEKAS